jgi:hypothetical protein
VTCRAAIAAAATRIIRDRICTPRPASGLQRFEHPGRVGVHVELHDAAVAHVPGMGKGRGHRPAGGLEGAGVDPERDHAITLGDKIGRRG